MERNTKMQIRDLTSDEIHTISPSTPSLSWTHDGASATRTSYAASEVSESEVIDVSTHQLGQLAYVWDADTLIYWVSEILNTERNTKMTSEQITEALYMAAASILNGDRVDLEALSQLDVGISLAGNLKALCARIEDEIDDDCDDETRESVAADASELACAYSED